MKVLVTGAAGFIGRNLTLRLREAGHGVLAVVRSTSAGDLEAMAGDADAVFHLAGANRPDDDAEFDAVNDAFTARICNLLKTRSATVPVIAASTIQVERDTPYGRSKRAAEDHLRAFGAATGGPVNITRLANVFGKWCRPNYNSVVATFCHNIARDLPIAVHDPSAEVRLTHIDDVIDGWLAWLSSPSERVEVTTATPEYRITLRDLANTLRGYRAVRQTHTVGNTGTGFGRVLYATFVSYLPPEDFTYPIHCHRDDRGVFAEVLRTAQSGQFSFFTAGPGVTRGGHYHHVKTEKFLVLKGSARFRFRCMDTGATHAIETCGNTSKIVETVPGWSHDITNIGDEDLVCMLWANEVFDRERPDTIGRLIASDA